MYQKCTKINKINTDTNDQNVQEKCDKKQTIYFWAEHLWSILLFAFIFLFLIPIFVFLVCFNSVTYISCYCGSCVVEEFF